MEDLDPILGAVAALPAEHAADSDVDMESLLRTVEDADKASASRYVRRGWLLMRMARAAKALKRARREREVPAHIQTQIAVHNDDIAKTFEDVIDFSSRRPRRLKGSVSYKQWTPQAMMRVCWGLRPRKRMCKKSRFRIRRKRSVSARQAPTVSSTRTCAAPMH